MEKIIDCLVVQVFVISSQKYWSKCTSYKFWKELFNTCCCFSYEERYTYCLSRKAKINKCHRTTFYSVFNMSSCRKLEIHTDLPKINQIKWICYTNLTNSAQKSLRPEFFFFRFMDLCIFSTQFFGGWAETANRHIFHVFWEPSFKRDINSSVYWHRVSMWTILSMPNVYIRYISKSNYMT